MYDTKGSIWESPYYADGKVFVGTDSGDLFIFKHLTNPPSLDWQDFPATTPIEARKGFRNRQKEIEKAVLLAKIEFDAPIRSTPTVAGCVLYIATERSLYAIGKR